VEGVAVKRPDTDRIDRRFRVAALEQYADYLEAKVAALDERHEAHLLLIRRLSDESITTEEADELRSQVASLMAEVGTLKSRLREAQDDAEIWRDAYYREAMAYD
jgi:hypothetical protein